jgi:hypothetical protein
MPTTDIVAFLTSELAKDILLPLITFAAGATTAWALERRRHRKEMTSKHVENLTNALREWYNEINDLVIEIDQIQVADWRLRKYETSRNFLPRVQFHLEALRKFPKFKKLVSISEQFLEIATKKKSANSFDDYACFILDRVDIMTMATNAHSETAENTSDEEDQPPSSSTRVENLDNIIQQLHNEAGGLM